MRSKEEAHDYRYFPDPDLLPLELAPSLVDGLGGALAGTAGREEGALHARVRACRPMTPSVLVAERETAEFFEAVVASERAERDAESRRQLGDQRTCRPAQQGRQGHCRVAGERKRNSAPSSILWPKVRSPAKIAKDVFEIVWNEGGDPRAIVETRGLKQVTDVSALEKLVDEIIAQNPDKVGDAKTNPKAIGWFVGQVMKASGGKANPQAVNDLLKKRLGI